MTWQFCSIRLLQRPEKKHELTDDLESLYWVLIYGALHFCAHEKPNFLTGNDIFSEAREIIDEGRARRWGGWSKRDVLFDFALVRFPFACKPLRDLISVLSADWRRYYATPEKKPGYGVEDPSWWTKVLDAALTQEGWPEGDFVEDQFPPRTSQEVQKILDAAHRSTYDSSHLTGEESERGLTVTFSGYMESVRHSRSIIGSALTQRLGDIEMSASQILGQRKRKRAEPEDSALQETSRDSPKRRKRSDPTSERIIVKDHFSAPKKPSKRQTRPLARKQKRGATSQRG